MPVSIVVATWNTARKCSVNSRVASIINANPVIVSMSVPYICLNSTIAGPLPARDMFVPIKLSQICCAAVCNPRVPHRIASVHNSPVCSANFIIDQPNARLIWFLNSSFYTDDVKRVSIDLLLFPNYYRVCIRCTVYLHVYTTQNDP